MLDFPPLQWGIEEADIPISIFLEFLNFTVHSVTYFLILVAFRNAYN